ncbi:ANR family transcriptional regulator [Serratia fonticola]|uniref:ANR family transcriptional regulator n=1 Tax=Serratia fonticola TaxID=47917 RepID=UPI002DBBC563|nr:ANR family transcriptional regulator [Serratia fonticola]MEB7884029.1 ANR family transcriptional regulator [Serratia fonticola]
MATDQDCDDISDISGSLQALLVRPTKREQHQTLSLSAALLERERNYVAASQQWLAASQLASASVDRHWCEARAHLCERRIGLTKKGK